MQLGGSPALFDEQMAVVARRVFVQLCVVCQLWQFMDQEPLCSITQVLVISQLDYCNGLMDKRAKSQDMNFHHQEVFKDSWTFPQLSSKL